MEVLERANGQAPAVVARATVPATDRIDLRLTGDDRVLAFAYAVTGRWETLVSDADATVLRNTLACSVCGIVKSPA